MIFLYPKETHISLGCNLFENTLSLAQLQVIVDFFCASFVKNSSGSYLVVLASFFLPVPVLSITILSK